MARRNLKSMTEIDFFFYYNKDVDGITKFSNLCLLRRDINTCLGINPNDLTSKLGYNALWPGAMGIFAGIDLLAKFYSGCDNDKSRARFINYVENFICKKYKEELYQLRNALLHSFGLHSEKEKKVYKFRLNQAPICLIKKIANDNYCVSIIKLHELFEKSIAEFLLIYPSLNSYKKFSELYFKYGVTEIKPGLC